MIDVFTSNIAYGEVPVGGRADLGWSIVLTAICHDSNCLGWMPRIMLHGRCRGVGIDCATGSC